jgi:hypothetical protein
MDIKVNGEPLALGKPLSGSLGDTLSAIDELLDTAGSIIVGLRIDGQNLDPDDFPRIKDRPISEFALIEVDAETQSAIKVKAISTLLELASLTEDAAAADSSEDWPALASGLGELAEAFAGLFSADELSFVQGAAELAARAASQAPSPDAATKAELAAKMASLSVVFRERLSEIQAPEEEMRKAAALYAAQAEELKELPVLLQTGKDDRAMKAIFLFIEIFNKVIRLVPELEGRGLDTKALKIVGESLPEFYASFNDVLRRLSSAFEDRDSVLIGDLAEYEVAPRMASFFAAVEEALAPK